MGSYVLRRRIDASPHRVFQAFTDPVLAADWLDASGIIAASGPLDVEGTTYVLVIRGPWRFRSRVVRSQPPMLHETAGQAPLGGSFRMVATLAERDGGTDLELLTEYTVPLGPIGRWIDRRWIDRGEHPTANREVDRLVQLVSEPPSPGQSTPPPDRGTPA